MGALLAIAAAVGAASCASGPSKSEFTEKAAPPCETANTSLNGVPTPADLKQLGEGAAKVKDATSKQVSALRKLERPSEDESALDKAFRTMTATATEAGKIADGVTAGDTKAVESAVTDFKSAAEEADRAARAYGLTQCGVKAKDISIQMDQAVGDILKKEFISKADALCSDANRKIDSVNVGDGIDDLVRFLDQAIPINEQLTTDLKALHVPLAHQAPWNEIVLQQEETLKKVRELREVAAARNGTRAEQLVEEIDLMDSESLKMLDAYGFDECGS